MAGLYGETVRDGRPAHPESRQTKMRMVFNCKQRIYSMRIIFEGVRVL